VSRLPKEVKMDIRSLGDLGSGRGLVEDAVEAALPGDYEPEEHVLERIDFGGPTKGLNRVQYEKVAEAHRKLVAGEPVYHQGMAPVEDQGGVTVPYDSERAAPSVYAESAPRRGTKMKVQTFDESEAEIARERCKLRDR